MKYYKLKPENAKLIEVGLQYLLTQTRTGKRIKLPKYIDFPLESYPEDLLLLGIWGLSYLRQRLLYEILDAENKLARFTLASSSIPIFKKIAENPNEAEKFIKNYSIELQEYEDEIKRISIAPTTTAKQWFGEWINIEEDYRGINIEKEKEQIRLARKQLEKIDKFLVKFVKPYYSQRISELKKQLKATKSKRLKKELKSKIDNLEYELKTQFGTAVAKYIVGTGKFIAWIKELLFIAGRIAGLSSGPERKVEKIIADLLRDYYRKEPVIMGNISTINVLHRELKRLRIGESEFEVRPFVYFSARPLFMLNFGEYDDFLAGILADIVISTQKKKDLEKKGKSDLALNKKLDILKEIYKQFKKAKGNKKLIEQLSKKAEYKKYLRYYSPAPNQPYLTWWHTKDGSSLIFPNLADEYQYFYSLFVKRGKEGKIVGIKKEFFEPIKYLPRYSRWYQRHLRQVAKWFGQDFKTMFEPGEISDEKLQSVKMFNYLKIMPKIRRLASGEGIREVDRKFLEDMISATYLLRRSLDNDFIHDPITGKKLPPEYQLPKKDILPYPPDWQPHIIKYDKKEITSLLNQLQNTLKEFEKLFAERHAKQLKKKKKEVSPELLEKRRRKFISWSKFVAHPYMFSESEREELKSIIQSKTPPSDFVNDMLYYCNFKYPMLKRVKGKVEIVHLPISEIPEKFKVILRRKPELLELIAIDNALKILFPKVKNICKPYMGKEIQELLAEIFPKKRM